MQLEARKGDITKFDSDAIVNAANSSLMGGGGVDGAIHRAGGPAILEACRKIIAKQGSCKTGEAVITGAGQLSAKFIIHTVGPLWRGGSFNEAELLAACYRNSLLLAEKYQLRSVAFPCISTGIYGYPKALAGQVAVQTTRAMADELVTIEKILFVCFDEKDFSIYQNLLM